MYTFGMEEEYFLFDAKTRHAVRRASKKFLALAQKQLGDRVMTEMLQSQLEVATPPCATMDEARGHLRHYRQTLAKAGAVRRTRRARWLSPRTSASTWRDSTRTWRAPK